MSLSYIHLQYELKSFCPSIKKLARNVVSCLLHFDFFQRSMPGAPRAFGTCSFWKLGKNPASAHVLLMFVDILDKGLCYQIITLKPTPHQPRYLELLLDTFESLRFGVLLYIYQNIHAILITLRGEGGGGVLIIFLGGAVPSGPENPYPISDQNIRFSIPYFRPDSQNVYPISDPVMCGKFSMAYGTSWRPKRCVFFLCYQHLRKRMLL